MRELDRLAEDWPVGRSEPASPHSNPPPGPTPRAGEETTAIPAETLAGPGSLRPTDCETARDPNGGSKPPKKRGRPTKIPDALKEKALKITGGKARAQTLYQTRYPTPQQKKNVSAILRHYKKSHPSTEG